MIDSIKFTWHMTTKVMKRLRSPNTLAYLGLKIYHEKRFYLKHPFGYCNIPVVFDFDARVMTIARDMSIAKLLQGHNVFGSNDVQGLALNAIAEVYEQLGLEFTDAELDRIQKGRIRLGRIDITCSFRLNSQPEVQDALELILQHLQVEGAKWSGLGRDSVETVYVRQDGKRVAEKFYNKRIELMHNKIPVDLPERERIRKHAEGLLRYEMTLRARELKRLNLEYADQWSPEVVKNILMGRIAKFKFNGVIKEHISQPAIDGLKGAERVFYEVREQGTDLSKVPSYAPLIRARNAILTKHGLDIFLPRGVGADLPLNEILTAKNAYFWAPKALRTRGAIFGAM